MQPRRTRQEEEGFELKSGENKGGREKGQSDPPDEMGASKQSTGAEACKKGVQEPFHYTLFQPEMYGDNAHLLHRLTLASGAALGSACSPPFSEHVAEGAPHLEVHEPLMI